MNTRHSPASICTIFFPAREIIWEKWAFDILCLAQVTWITSKGLTFNSVNNGLDRENNTEQWSYECYEQAPGITNNY